MGVLSKELRERIRQEFPKYPNKQAVTLPALHLVHDAMRAVSTEAIVEIADLLELHPAEIHDTMSFYNFFKDEQHALGKHRIWVCRSISCMLRGGEEVFEQLSQKYHLHPGETSADGKLTLEFAECLGACEGAPCILVDDECYMEMSAESAGALIEKL